VSYLSDTQTNRQTDKQTKTGKNITSLAEVIIKKLEKMYRKWLHDTEVQITLKNNDTILYNEKSFQHAFKS